MNALIINIPVEMDETVPKTRHPAQVVFKIFAEHTILYKDYEPISIVIWKAVVFGRYDVICDVDTALYGNDEVVFCVADLVRP